MNLDDFKKYFESLDICNLGPDVADELDQAKQGQGKEINVKVNKVGPKPTSKKKWVVNSFEGRNKLEDP